jgi:hypothetical protein
VNRNSGATNLADLERFRLSRHLRLVSWGSLWRVLAVVGETDDRLRGNDFEQLIARAQEQQRPGGTTPHADGTSHL